MHGRSVDRRAWSLLLAACCCAPAGCGGAGPGGVDLVDDTSSSVATVDDAARLLDLRTFPLPEGDGAEPPVRQVGELSYQPQGDVIRTFGFYRDELKRRGWRELPGSRDTGPNPRALFTRDGFVVSLSVGTYVTIQNHGNVVPVRLPVPDGATPHHLDDLSSATFVTTADAATTAAECRRLLLERGWEPYGTAGNTAYFKKNAVRLSADVMAPDARPGTTFVSYSTALLSADLPLPAEADDPRYTDVDKRLFFTCKPDETDAVDAFYRRRLASQGWKPTTDRPVTIAARPVDVLAVVFRNERDDMITLDMQPLTDQARVEVRHQTAAEVAADDRAIAARGASLAASTPPEQPAPPETPATPPVVASPVSPPLPELVTTGPDRVPADAFAGPDAADGPSAAGFEPSLPVPDGAADVIEEGTAFRTSIRAQVTSGLGAAVEFYRRELPARGWKEQAGAATVAEDRARLAFDGPEGAVLVQLRGQGEQVMIDLIKRDTEGAKRAGVVPPAGTVLLLLANAHDRDAVILIDGAEHPVAAGVGAENPATARRLELVPGRHAIRGRVPGADDSSEEIEVAADETWTVIVVPTGACVAEQIF